MPTIGRAIPAPLRREGPDKLTGKARYTDDYVFPGAWYGATIRSTVPHARLLGLELDPAFDWSRVVVMTAADIPGENVVASINDDMPALAADTIRHHAEPVALLAAPDKETLREARKRIEMRGASLSSRSSIHSDPTQQFAAYEVNRGNVEAAFASATLVVQGEYRVGHQEQLYIENQAMIAEPRPDGGDHHHRLDAVPLLRAQALKRALDG